MRSGSRKIDASSASRVWRATWATRSALRWSGPAIDPGEEGMTLRLTVGFSDNPRVQPLKDGAVKPQNIELGFVTLDPSPLVQRNLLYDQCDASDMSIAATLQAGERTD